MPAASHSFPDAVEHPRISGSEPLRRPYLATPVLEIVRSRVVWLLVGATLTVKALESFEATSNPVMC